MFIAFHHWSIVKDYHFYRVFRNLWKFKHDYYTELDKIIVTGLVWSYLTSQTFFKLIFFVECTETILEYNQFSFCTTQQYSIRWSCVIYDLMRNTCAITEYNECVTVTVSSIKLVYMLMYKRRTETCTVCCLWIPAKAQHGRWLHQNDKIFTNFSLCCTGTEC